MATSQIHLRQMRRAAEYAARYAAVPTASASASVEDAIGWARYHAGQIIGGVCDHCGERNGAHAYGCRNHHSASASLENL